MYRLDLKFKTDATYLAVFNGETEVVTLNDAGILTKADERTTAEQQDGWWIVRAYFTANGNGISLRKASTDSAPVTIGSFLLLKTKIHRRI